LLTKLFYSRIIVHDLKVLQNLLIRVKIYTWKVGTISWPVNSPDLTALDTFLWGYLKDKLAMELDLSAEIVGEIILPEVKALNNENNNFVQGQTVHGTEKVNEDKSRCVCGTNFRPLT